MGQNKADSLIIHSFNKSFIYLLIIRNHATLTGTLSGDYSCNKYTNHMDFSNFNFAFKHWPLNEMFSCFCFFNSQKLPVNSAGMLVPVQGRGRHRGDWAAFWPLNQERVKHGSVARQHHQHRERWWSVEDTGVNNCFKSSLHWFYTAQEIAETWVQQAHTWPCNADPRWDFPTLQSPTHTCAAYVQGSERTSFPSQPFIFFVWI